PIRTPPSPTGGTSNGPTAPATPPPPVPLAAAVPQAPHPPDEKAQAKASVLGPPVAPSTTSEPPRLKEPKATGAGAGPPAAELPPVPAVPAGGFAEVPWAEREAARARKMRTFHVQVFREKSSDR
ncbi:unnamed protein product, partial [Effrenium voratum]